MDFSLSAQQAELKKDAVTFAQDELVSDSVWGEVMEGFQQDDWDKCAKKGVLGWLAPTNLGGYHRQSNIRRVAWHPTASTPAMALLRNR